MKLPKLVPLWLTPDLFERVKRQAKREGVGVNQLIRSAIEGHWGLLKLLEEHHSGVSKLFPQRNIDLNKPLVTWTLAEKRFADEVIQQFFDEDR